MAAGLGFKTFTTGEVLSSTDVNGYLMQGVLVFASTAARDAAITSPQEGQFAYTKDTNGLWYYDGAAWVASGATGDIEGVTAGVGISGGGTSGTVTVTNSMATAITTAGDLIYGTGSGTFTRRAIGSTGNVLTVAGGVPTWAAPAGGGSGLTLISTTTVSSGSSVNINSVFSATYDNYLIVANLKAGQDVGNFQLRASTTTTTTGYYYAGQRTQSNNSGPTLFYGANTASINIQEIGTDFGVLTIEVNNPYVADTTAISATAIMNNLTQLKVAYLGGAVNNTTSYDGFTLSLDSGGFGSGGKVRVYGYANS